MNIAIIASSPMTINAFLQDFIVRLSEVHQITVITNIFDISELKLPGNNVVVHPLKINRKISLLEDLNAQFELIKLFYKNKFDLVYSVTPKAGLLSMSAGFIARNQYRVHIFTGQVWVTRSGINRFFLKTIDKIIARFATHLLADSQSQMQFLVSSNVVDKRKIKVLANGSICGVNLNRFVSNEAIRLTMRQELGIENSEIAFLFLGRLDPDKGILDLVDAFELLVKHYNYVKLLVVGPDEAQMREEIVSNIGNASDCIQFVDFTEKPQSYMNAADVLCLPSYREGFGSVVIEAAAVGIPAIGSNIYGISDAIEDNVTGLLFPVCNVEALFEAMKVMVTQENLRKKFGDAAKQRAVNKFSQEYVTNSFIEYFEKVSHVGR